jgi:hypothetical protein
LLGDFEHLEHYTLCGQIAYSKVHEVPRLTNGTRPCKTCFRLYMSYENGERPPHLPRWTGDLTGLGYPTRVGLLMEAG